MVLFKSGGMRIDWFGTLGVKQIEEKLQKMGKETKFAR